MSMREKTAWIAVVASLLIWGYYFSVFWGAVIAHQLDGHALFWLFVFCIGLSLAVMLPLNIIAALTARQKMDAPPDERERLIDARANRIGLGLLEVMALLVIGFSVHISDLAREAFPQDPAGATALIMSNALMMVLALAATAREIIQIISFRMMD